MYWSIVTILIIAIGIWGFADGIAPHSPLAILGLGFIFASIYGVLNGKKQPILSSLRKVMYRTKFPWIGITGIVLGTAGIVWLYAIETNVTSRIFGLFVFFTTLYHCLDIGNETGKSPN